ncbi:MAG: NYN domain-containing protein, partial [Gammaproteobacteria bacterium]|nr:NYN domain-containing protein [Gammaproteobacteria bacterium]
LFIDGNNWYHSLRAVGVDSGRLNYRRVAEKLLLASRQLAGIRYYVGEISGDLARMRKQQKMFAGLRLQGVHVSLGRIEKIEIPPKRNPLVADLQRILSRSGARMPEDVRRELAHICRKRIPTYTEKQVDVRIAVDLVSMAQRDEYDAAYLLSADGDFVPAVNEVKLLGKRIFAVSASPGQRLKDAADSFIRLDRDWFAGCYR